MKVHITNIYGIAGTAKKAQDMVTDIATKKMHYNELGIYRYPIDSDSSEMLRTRLDGIVASVSSGDIVIIQLPTWNGIRFDEALVRHLDNYRGLRKIFFIHDVPPLMFENGIGLDRYIALYNRADLIIASSDRMVDFLRSEGLTVKKIIIQRMWDFPVDIDWFMIPKFTKRINFAANVAQIHRPFAVNWNYDKVELALTAKKEDCDWAKEKNISFLGWFGNDNLLANALRKSGGFGLLWHDSPWWVEYMKLNASFKLGNYLAAGIPVIVPSSIAEKDTIIRKNLGLAVDSIDEAVERIENMSEAEYVQMITDVGAFSNLIREGYFTKKVLVDAVFKLFFE